MADIAASNVVVTLVARGVLPDGRRIHDAKIQFGDGVLTYPAGGIPIRKGDLGCPTIVNSLICFDDGNGAYKVMFDQTNSKLILKAGGASHSHDLLIKGGQTAASTNTVAAEATAILGKQEATDATILGSASASKGGVLAGGGEPTGLAIAAMTLKCQVIGW